MSIYHSTPQRCTNASDKISADIERYLSAGGEIEQVPTGQSAYSLQVREVKSRGKGTRRAWVDERLSMRSEMAKGLSVRTREAREVERAAAKKLADRRRKQNGRAAHMPRVRGLLEQGKTRREIAETIGVSHGTINNWIRLEGGQ